MGVVEVPARFFRLNPACALHENACNDLEAVCHPMLDLLQQDRFFANQIIFQSSLGAHIGHVGYGQKQANMIDVAVVERPRIDDQLPCFLVWPLKVDFVGFDMRTS